MEKKTKKHLEEEREPKVYGDPIYLSSEDIYSRGEKEEVENSDESAEAARTTKNKAKHPSIGDDLDVPGSELDDQDEAIGEEDEENNYYSLGGDDHDDLEEDKGD